MAKSVPVSPGLARCTHPSFFFFFNSWVFLFISLAASGLSCSTLDLSLWCIGSSVVACRLSCRKASGIFPDQGSNPCPLHWKVDGFLTTGPPGMSLYSLFLVVGVIFHSISWRDLHSQCVRSFMLETLFDYFLLEACSDHRHSTLLSWFLFSFRALWATWN